MIKKKKTTMNDNLRYESSRLGVKIDSEIQRVSNVDKNDCSAIFFNMKNWGGLMSKEKQTKYSISDFSCARLSF